MYLIHKEFMILSLKLAWNRFELFIIYLRPQSFIISFICNLLHSYIQALQYRLVSTCFAQKTFTDLVKPSLAYQITEKLHQISKRFLVLYIFCSHTNRSNFVREYRLCLVHLCYYQKSKKRDHIKEKFVYLSFFQYNGIGFT